MHSPLFSFVRQWADSVCRAAKWYLRRCTKPNNHALLLNVVTDLARSKSELMLENALLPQQLIILRWQVKRLRLTWRDRMVLVLLASKLHSWKQVLVIAQPETLLRWDRDLFRRVWKRKSRSKGNSGRPPLPKEVVALIKQMAQDNLTWGAKRIRGELLKLGLQVSKNTIRKYIKQVHPSRSSKQNWATFLRNHANQIWACDFLQTYDVLFRTVFVFVIIELGSRRVVHHGVTRHPTDAWIAQQLREATPYRKGPRYLIRDNDSEYGASFERVATGTETEVLKTPYRAPRANAICERFLGSLRRECLDNFVLLSERHLYRVVKEYVGYFNGMRPHQGVEQRTPCGPAHPDGPPITWRVASRSVLGGLHHEYAWQVPGSTCYH